MLNRSFAPSHVGGERDGGEHDRHRAAQAGPAEEDLLAPRPREPDGARQRPTAAGRRTSGARRRRAPSTRASASNVPGVASRPSMTNSPIWASQPMPSTNERVARAVRQLGVAEHQRGEVDGREPARVDGGRRAVRQHREREDDERVEAGRRQGEPAQQRAPQPKPSARPMAAPTDQLEHDQPDARPNAAVGLRWLPALIATTSTTIGASLRPDSASSVPRDRFRSGTVPEHGEDRRRVRRGSARRRAGRRAPSRRSSR